MIETNIDFRSGSGIVYEPKERGTDSGIAFLIAIAIMAAYLIGFSSGYTKGYRRCAVLNGAK